MSAEIIAFEPRKGRPTTSAALVRDLTDENTAIRQESYELAASLEELGVRVFNCLTRGDAKGIQLASAELRRTGARLRARYGECPCNCHTEAISTGYCGTCAGNHRKAA